MYFDRKKAHTLVLRSKKSLTQIVNESGLSQRTVYTLLNNNFIHDPKLSTVSALARTLGANFMDLLSE